MPPRVFLAMSRSACSTVSVARAELQDSGRRRTAPGRGRRWGTAVIGDQLRGLAARRARTGRRTASSRRRSVTVRPSGTTVGPEHARVRRRPADADRRRRAAGGQEPGPVGHRLEQVGQLGPVVSGHGERHDGRRPVRLGQDARLVTAVERDRGQPAVDQASLGRPGRSGAGRRGGVPGPPRPRRRRRRPRRPRRRARRAGTTAGGPGSRARPGRPASGVGASRRPTCRAVARTPSPELARNAAS